MMKPTPLAAIGSFHAHIYFKDAAEREHAAALRDQIAERFAVRLGRWHEKPIGPHARPMYQVAFPVHVFPGLIPWLMLNRQGLTILVHPNTSNPRRDHVINPFWMGEILPIIHPEQLPDHASGDDSGPFVTNTQPVIPA